MATHAPQPSYTEASLIEPPPRDLGKKPNIQFLHPGYQRPVNAILTLPRVDAESSNGPIAYGVHHKTALTACQIIADKYPIVPSFKDWEFPHEEVPDLWPTVSMNYFDNSGFYESLCSVTSVSYAVDRVHLIPQEEAAWYNYNGMRIYGEYIDCEDNILCLGKNLHKCFDDAWFAIVPKSTPSGIQCVTHILSVDATEIWPTYQNSIVRGLNFSSRPHLFARFAWAIFRRAKLFVSQGYSRHVIREHVDWEEGSVEWKQELMTGIQLQRLYEDGWYTSATPISGDETDGSDTEVEAVDW